ncbi:uncharacterized protein GGS22DRAFT_153895 [Annulohypoxylon maeteangense]|uniref:uncharacterized protein n=1 Tax=Annulohypoxylon maeteangense TaxID=1927788 RepID=UPI00200838A6|nr:uncharacterized protein GGS22DRAFT_153895 [Annulohypoxylon maeteangense]KAI0889441.1 hypothetical protein GGS22DRAFT_153895 [Annulohypoxylon maeteangense]
MDTSPLLRAPAEVRMMIYDYLFNDGGNKQLRIQNATPSKLQKSDGRIRSKYYVLERSFHRRCYTTTYQLGTEGVSFCASFMRVNKKIYEETAYLVYGGHTFDFGSHIEAVEPFLSDLTPPSRQLIREISLYKRGPEPPYDYDRSEWRNVCRFLQDHASIKKLRLMVQGGRPNTTWEGPKEFTVDDLKLLFDIKHESLDWVGELIRVKGIEELEVLPDVQYCPPPSSTNMIIFAALSASIEKGLTEFLRTQLRLPQ